MFLAKSSMKKISSKNPLNEKTKLLFERSLNSKDLSEINKENSYLKENLIVIT